MQKPKQIIKILSAVGIGTLIGILYNHHQYQKNNTINKWNREEGNQKKLQEIKKTWGKNNLAYSDNSLFQELKILSVVTCQIQKIAHLAIDLQMEQLPEIKCQASIKLFTQPGTFILSSGKFGTSQPIAFCKKWLRAGVRQHQFFKQQEVRAAIVTCGGLCPGLNTVIRQLVHILTNVYSVEKVFGIKYGLRGFYEEQWEELKIKNIRQLHHYGGTYLGSSRGGFDLQKIIDSLVSKGVNQVYMIGGDGSMKAIYKIYKEIKKRKLRIAVCGIPKTIDNDIPIIDRSFGFQSSIQSALVSLESAYVEAMSHKNGIGLVKLMGRNAGFIAMQATLASRKVSACLVPQFQFDIYGQHGFLEFVLRRYKANKQTLIVVAQGAANSIRDYLLQSRGKDQSGNTKMGDIGQIIKDEILKYLQSHGHKPTLKYIDPTYIIRDVPANSFDTKLCTQLAYNAAFSVMAGFTGFTCGHVTEKAVLIPLSEIISQNYANRIMKHNSHWQRLLGVTGQPSFLNDQQKVALKQN